MKTNIIVAVIATLITGIAMSLLFSNEIKESLIDNSIKKQCKIIHNSIKSSLARGRVEIVGYDVKKSLSGGYKGFPQVYLYDCIIWMRNPSNVTYYIDGTLSIMDEYGAIIKNENFSYLNGYGKMVYTTILPNTTEKKVIIIGSRNKEITNFDSKKVAKAVAQLNVLVDKKN